MNSRPLPDTRKNRRHSPAAPERRRRINALSGWARAPRPDDALRIPRGAPHSMRILKFPAFPGTPESAPIGATHYQHTPYVSPPPRAESTRSKHRTNAGEGGFASAHDARTIAARRRPTPLEARSRRRAPPLAHRDQCASPRPQALPANTHANRDGSTPSPNSPTLMPVTPSTKVRRPLFFSLQSGVPRFLLALAALLCSWAAVPAQTPDPGPGPFPEPAVGRIDLKDADGNGLNAATGFWISSTEVVTCWHVARIGRHATIVMPDGATHTLTHLIGCDERADIALLRADPPFDGRTLPLSHDTPADQTPVRVIGYQGRAHDPALEGVLQSQLDLPYNGTILDLDMARGIAPGFSGSPVIDICGRVLGLVSFGQPGKAFGGAAPQIQALRSGDPLPIDQWDRAPHTRFGRANLAMSTAETIESKQFDQAMRTLRNAAAESPDCWPLWGHLLANYKSVGDADAALDAATHAATGPTAQHALSLAALLRAKGRNDEATAAEQRAAKIDPGGLRYIQARDRGLKAVQESRFKDALPDLNTAVNGSPDSLDLWSNLLLAMAQAGYAAQAAPDSERLVAHFPTSAVAHYTRGVVIWRAGNPVAAMKEFQAATAIDPSLAPPHHQLGILLATIRDFPAAEDELATLKRLNPALAQSLADAIAKARAGER